MATFQPVQGTSNTLKAVPSRGALPFSSSQNLPFTQSLPSPNISGAVKGALGVANHILGSLPAPTAIPRPSYLPAAPQSSFPAGMFPSAPTAQSSQASGGTTGGATTGAVKSHKVAADGSVQVDYHKPEIAKPQLTAAAGTAPTYDPAGGGGHAIIPASGVQGLVPPPNAGTTGATATGTTPVPPTDPSTDNQQHTDFLSSIQQLINASNAPSQQQQEALQQFQQFQQDYANSMANIQGRIEPLEFQQGQAQVVANRYANLMPYYTAALQAAQTGKGQQITGLTSAAGQLAPQLGAYGQTFYQPAQAGTVGGGAGMTGLDPQTQATQLAELVNSGQMTYADAVSQMTGGAAGTPALRNAILAKNPNFNFAQATSLGTTQGQVAPALQAGTVALQNLQNTLSQVPEWQKSSVPLFNAMGNLFSSITGIGLQSQKEKQDAINEARTQLSTALGTVTNTTPTAYTAMVDNWIPDNATPQDVQAAITQFNTLAENARQRIYGTPGSVQPFSAGATGTSGGASDSSLYNF